jgi:hypothetical protein
MNRSSVLALLFLGGTVAIAPSVSPPSAEAVELSDGTVYFVSPPRLDPDSVYSSRSSPAALGATYYFTLTVPEDAGEPLSQVSITQREGDTARQRVIFQPAESFAFEGTRRDRGDALPLNNATFNADDQTLTLTFDPPVEPGTTVTVGVRPRNNPLSEGVYLFGITAYPPGEQVHGQFLGYGRLHFYRQDSIFWR